jgi:transcription antitermination factor NusG
VLEEVSELMREDELLKILGEGGGRTGWFRRKIVSRKQGFQVGDSVRIKSGPFASFVGTVIGINQAKSLLKVAVTIFGHQKPLKLRFSEVEKVPGI